MSTDQLMDKLTSAVSFKFKEDKTAPGVTVSKLKTGYYCSVVRYTDAFGKGKKVVCKAKGDSLPVALATLAQSFVALSAQPKNPVDELRDELIQKA